ncbi:MAG: YbbR domain-containing protein [Clostridium sp.]|jgi:YbbR domain-containing protein
MDKDGKEQFIIKCCCVILAFALWLFITSTEYPLDTYKIKSIPVQILNGDTLTRSNLVLVPGQELTTTLNIKGANTSVLLATKAENFTVVVDLEAYALKSGEQNIPIEIRKSPDNINVVNSDSLFIKINLDQRTTAKLPINVNVSGKPKEGYFASAAKLSQSDATVVGGSKFVNLVKEILVEENIQDLDVDVSKTYKLKPVDASGKEVENVVVNPAQIDVKIPISKTKSVGVTVKTIGILKDGFTLTSAIASPKQFSITGNEAVLNKMENLNTDAIDLSKINKTTILDAKVIIPDGLSLVSGSDTVKIEIKLDKEVQKTLSQDIEYINLNVDYEVKLEKIKDSLVFSGTEAVINSLDLKKISATIDLVNLVEGKHTVPIKVVMPEGVKLVSQVPDKILVTITKKLTEVPTSNDNKVE